MARARIPDPLSRRHLVESDLDPAKAKALAEAYLAEERVIDALPFLAKAGDRERLEALRREAVEAGDPFLLRQVAEALGEPPDAAAWRELAERAAAAGKEVYATEARRNAAALEG